MSSYHGWTHRPKALGGTDPIPAAGESLTASFWRVLNENDQQIEHSYPINWVPVDMDSGNMFTWNWDLITGGPAVELVDDSDESPGDRLVFINADVTLDARHYWVIGAQVNLGAWQNPLDSNFDYPGIDQGGYDSNSYLLHWGVRLVNAGEGGSSRETAQSVQEIGVYNGTGISDGLYRLFYYNMADVMSYATAQVLWVPNFSDVWQDPADEGGGGDADGRKAVAVEVFHSAEVIVDAGVSPRSDWPAIRGGFIWGQRYAIGDGVIN